MAYTACGLWEFRSKDGKKTSQRMCHLFTALAPVNASPRKSLILKRTLLRLDSQINDDIVNTYILILKKTLL